MCSCVNLHVRQEAEGERKQQGKHLFHALNHEKEHNLFKNFKPVSNGMSSIRPENGEKGHEADHTKSVSWA